MSSNSGKTNKYYITAMPKITGRQRADDLYDKAVRQNREALRSLIRAHPALARRVFLNKMYKEYIIRDERFEDETV